MRINLELLVRGSCDAAKVQGSRADSRKRGCRRSVTDSQVLISMMLACVG